MNEWWVDLSSPTSGFALCPTQPTQRTLPFTASSSRRPSESAKWGLGKVVCPFLNKQSLSHLDGVKHFYRIFCSVLGHVHHRTLPSAPTPRRMTPAVGNPVPSHPNRASISCSKSSWCGFLSFFLFSGCERQDCASILLTTLTLSAPAAQHLYHVLSQRRRKLCVLLQRVRFSQTPILGRGDGCLYHSRW